MQTTQATTPSEPQVRVCGWFDSSYELQSGVEVEEGQSTECFELWQLLQASRKGVTLQ
ncbi:MAG TPA: hypothetical protein VGE47_04700 [Burkholderiaceae bacterium]